jgi:hypothetical protein
MQAILQPRGSTSRQDRGARDNASTRVPLKECGRQKSPAAVRTPGSRAERKAMPADGIRHATRIDEPARALGMPGPPL